MRTHGARIAALLAFAAFARPATAKPTHAVVEQKVELEEDSSEDASDEKEPVADDTDDKEPPKKKHPTPKEDDEPDEPAPVAHEPEPAHADPAVWLSVGLMQDLAFLAGSQVCTEKNQVSGGYTCVRAGGSQYHGTPLPGAAGNLSGAALAATRATVAVYVRIADSISLGARLGGAFLGGGPRPDGGSSYLWFSAEAQGAYWLSRRAFSTKVVGTFIELSTGLAQIDGKERVIVSENRMAPPPVSQLDNPAVQSLDVYRKSGAAFAGAGAGLFLPFGSAGGLIADLRLMQLFPSSGTALSLGISGALGL